MLDVFYTEARSALDRAAGEAACAGIPIYVCYGIGGWNVTAVQPPVNATHWRVTASGEAGAHIADPGIADYNYEHLGVAANLPD